MLSSRFLPTLARRHVALTRGVLPATTCTTAPDRLLLCTNRRRWKSTVALNDDDHTSTSEDPPPTQKFTPPRKLPKPDFNDAKAAYESKSTVELWRAFAVFQLCRIPFLVKHSETLLQASRKVLGGTISDALLKATLFGHFCAGEDEKRIQPVLENLQSSGIGSILDYAHEDDGSSSSSDEEKEQPSSDAPTNTATSPEEILQEANPKVLVRTYDYESEHQCDLHVKTFEDCIHAVQHLDAEGYAAVKVTALGNPKLLERMSRALREVKVLFGKFDQDGDGFISRAEFEEGFNLFFRHDNSHDLEEMFDLLDPDHTGRVDFITWSMMLSPKDLPRITAKCRELGPLAMASPTEEEVELIEAMFERGHKLAKEASKCGVRLLIDAEQHRFQPAIDNLVLDLQRNFNATDKTDKPIIYNTYQCYLKDTSERLTTDMERSERHSYHFGAKLVRGAYMEGERALAETLGYESPIHETIEDTHACYDESVDYLLHQSKATTDRKVEMMLASHNQSSIEKAIETMDTLDIDPQDSTICFAQLYGMTDNLTYNLGQNGFRAYKYVPYGEVHEVMPYLVRRAQENSAVAGGAAKELQMIRAELERRMSFA